MCLVTANGCVMRLGSVGSPRIRRWGLVALNCALHCSQAWRLSFFLLVEPGTLPPVPVPDASGTLQSGQRGRGSSGWRGCGRQVQSLIRSCT